MKSLNLLEYGYGLRRNVNEHTKDKKAHRLKNVGRKGAFENKHFDDEKYYSLRDCS